MHGAQNSHVHISLHSRELTKSSPAGEAPPSQSSHFWVELKPSLSHIQHSKLLLSGCFHSLPTTPFPPCSSAGCWGKRTFTGKRTSPNPALSDPSHQSLSAVRGWGTIPSTRTPLDPASPSGSFSTPGCNPEDQGHSVTALLTSLFSFVLIPADCLQPQINKIPYFNLLEFINKSTKCSLTNMLFDISSKTLQV